MRNRGTVLVGLSHRLCGASDLLQLTVNGMEVEVEDGRTVLDAARKAKVFIPTLCAHQALEPYGACRVCLVEVTQRGRTRLVTACTYPAKQGASVQTDTDRVVKARRGVVQLLLARCSNSPEVKELAELLGVEPDERLRKKEEDCILCGLCVRICRDVMGQSVLGFVGRGVGRSVGVPFGKSSEFCMNCGACAQVCPTNCIRVEDICGRKVEPIRSEFDQGMGSRTPIHIRYPQAVPNVPAIDRDTCAHFVTGACKACQAVCEAKAIDFEQQDEEVEVEVGAAILTPGFEHFQADRKPEYGYGRFANVYTSPEFERVLSASGPYQGHVVRRSDGQQPKRVAFIQCVGSRDPACGQPFCSSVCCMYATKEAVIAREHVPGLESTIFFMDVRAFGKDFDKYVERAQSEHGVKFVRCRVGSVDEVHETQNLRIRYEDADGDLVTGEFDMVVLATGMRSPDGVQDLGRTLGLDLNEFGFCKTHEFDPLATSRDGVFVGGAFQGPKDIPETVTQGSGAAARVAAMLADARHTLAVEKQYPEETDLRGVPTRIGVFVCNCGINIGGYLDVPAVVEYATLLPHVVFADQNLFTCSQDSQEAMKAVIREHGLTRVVVASCTPRTHEPLFRETCREAGLNPYLFEMANIRDQCSWVHMHEPHAATEKAKDLVRMAVARARSHEPLTPTTFEVIPRALVVGGGLAGMTAALAIADQGFEVCLVEREGDLGGQLRDIHYTVSGSDAKALLGSTVAKVRSHGLITVLTEGEVESIEGFVGNYLTCIRTPEGPREFEHGVAVLATGAQENPVREYLRGDDPRVLTQTELEQRIVTDDETVTSANTIVMVQCVGSRDDERRYCSRFCCSEALKNALRILDRNPKAKIYVLYRDIRAYGFKELYFREARERGVVFLRYEPEDKPRVERVDGQLRVVFTDLVLHEELAIRPDLVVLSVGAVPRGDSEKYAQMLKVPLNADGFFLEAHMKLRPVDFATEGVFMCGTCHAPKMIDETIAQAYAAAARAGTVLAKREIQAEGTVSEVNLARCSACGTCESICPYAAIKVIDEEVRGETVRHAHVTPALCKGCGACVAACRSGAADLKGFSNEEILAALEAL